MDFDYKRRAAAATRGKPREQSSDEVLAKAKAERAERQRERQQQRSAATIQRWWRGSSTRAAVSSRVRTQWLQQHGSAVAQTQQVVPAAEVASLLLPPVLQAYLPAAAAPSGRAALLAGSPLSAALLADTAALRGCFALLLRSLAAPDVQHSLLALAAAAADPPQQERLVGQLQRLLLLCCAVLGTPSGPAASLDPLLQAAAGRIASILCGQPATQWRCWPADGQSQQQLQQLQRRLHAWLAPLPLLSAAGQRLAGQLAVQSSQQVGADKSPAQQQQQQQLVSVLNSMLVAQLQLWHQLRQDASSSEGSTNSGSSDLARPKGGSGSSSTGKAGAAATARLLSALAFGTQLLARLWRHLATTIGLPLEAPLQATRGWEVATLRRGIAGLQPVAAAQLGLFCRVYCHHLAVVDDWEFWERQQPFSLGQQRAIAAALNTLVFRTQLPDNGSSGGSMGQQAGGRSGSLGREYRMLQQAAPLLHRALYERDARRQFCPPALWLEPYYHLVGGALGGPQQAQQAQHVSGAAVVRALLASEEDSSSDGRPGASASSPRGGAAAAVGPAAGAGVGTAAVSRPAAVAAILTAAPQCVPFEERVAVFRALIDTDKERCGYSLAPVDGGARPLPLTIRRGYVLEDAAAQLGRMGSAVKSRLAITFINQQGLQEAGIDMGGLMKEFLESVVSAGFDPNRGLFAATPDGQAYPNPLAERLDGGLAALETMGLVLGRALYEGVLLDCPLAPFFVSRLQGRWPLFDELQALDPEVYRSLVQLKRYDGPVEDLCLDFTVESDFLGTTLSEELVPGGSRLAVTQGNLLQYVYLVADWHLNKRLGTAAAAFSRGLSRVIPASWLRLFSPREVNQLLGGGEAAALDIDDMQAHAVYGNGYSPSSSTVKHFWAVVRGMSEEEQRSLLKFVTSCSRAPLGGFKHLQPPLTIHKVDCGASLLAAVGGKDVDRLPTASTCSNTLKLPNFRRSATLREKLLYAIKSGAGFELLELLLMSSTRDIQLLRSLGIRNFRLSLSWPRLLPKGRGELNQEGVHFYNRVIDMLLASCIEPHVTFYHWDLPQALENEYGGWLSDRVVNDFAAYAEAAFKLFGDRVKYWTTINEPQTICNNGYESGVMAPGRCSNRTCCPEGNSTTEPQICAYHVLLAHAAAVPAFRRLVPNGKISLNTNLAPFLVPLTSSPEDANATEALNRWTSGPFLDPHFTGDWTAERLQLLPPDILPCFTPEQSQQLKAAKINYYNGAYGYFDPNSTFLSANSTTNSSDGTPLPVAESSWIKIFPSSIRNMLVWVDRRYGRPPILVTENGVSVPGENGMPLEQALCDTFRVDFYRQYMGNASLAKKEDGVDLQGYFAWSLLDNFEWADGYSVRFGIVYVDFNTLKRYYKASSLWLANLFNTTAARSAQEARFSQLVGALDRPADVDKALVLAKDVVLAAEAPAAAWKEADKSKLRELVQQVTERLAALDRQLSDAELAAELAQQRTQLTVAFVVLMAATHVGQRINLPASDAYRLVSCAGLVLRAGRPAGTAAAFASTTARPAALLPWLVHATPTYDWLAAFVAAAEGAEATSPSQVAGSYLMLVDEILKQECFAKHREALQSNTEQAVLQVLPQTAAVIEAAAAVCLEGQSPPLASLIHMLPGLAGMTLVAGLLHGRKVPLSIFSDWLEAAQAAVRLQPVLAQLHASAPQLAGVPVILLDNQPLLPGLSRKLLQQVWAGVPVAVIPLDDLPANEAEQRASLASRMWQLHTASCQLIARAAGQPGQPAAACPALAWQQPLDGATLWQLLDGLNKIFNRAHTLLRPTEAGEPMALGPKLVSQLHALCAAHATALQLLTDAVAACGGFQVQDARGTGHLLDASTRVAAACPSLVTPTFFRPVFLVNRDGSEMWLPLERMALVAVEGAHNPRLTAAAVLAGLFASLPNGAVQAAQQNVEGLATLAVNQCLAALLGLAQAAEQAGFGLVEEGAGDAERGCSTAMASGVAEQAQQAQQAQQPPQQQQAQARAALTQQLQNDAARIKLIHEVAQPRSAEGASAPLSRQAERLRQVLHVSPPAAAGLFQYYELLEQVTNDRLQTARAAAARACAYLRCANVAGGGGPAAGTEAGGGKCSKCRSVWYCSTTCSHADWRLECLVVIGYLLADLPGGPYLDRLTRLDLHNNCFERVPPALWRATRLQQLSLHDNPMQPNAAAVRLLAGLPALEEVQLPLSVLSSLTCLAFEDGSADDAGAAIPMRLPPAAAFPGLARLDATSYSFEVHDQRVVAATFETLDSSRRDRRRFPSISLSCTGERASLILRCLRLAEAGRLQALLPGLLPRTARLHHLHLLACFLGPHSFSGCGELLSGVAELDLNSTMEEGSTLTNILAALLLHTPQLRRLEVTGLGPQEYAHVGADEGEWLQAGLPPVLTSLTQLECLVVTGYLLEDLPSGPYLDSLTRLDLSHNCFERLPAALRRASRLQQLSLTDNAYLPLDAAAVRLLASLPALARVGLPLATPDRLVRQLRDSGRLRLAAAAMPPAGIAALPDELLGHILALAGVEKGFPALLVCKRWNRVVWSPAAAQLWRSLDIEVTVELASDAMLLATTSHLVQRTGRFAERAALRACRFGGAADSLPAAAPAVDSYGCDSWVVGIIEWLSPASLRRLEVWLLPLPGHAVPSLSRFSCLQSLCLGHRRLRFTGEAAGALSQLTALTALELMGKSLDAHAMHAVVHLSRLHSLDLWAQQPLVEVNSLSALSALTLLRLEHGPAWRDPDSSLMVLPPAAAFPSLARLDVVSLQLQASLTLRCLELEEGGSLRALLEGLLPPAARLHRLELESCGFSPLSCASCNSLLAHATELILGTPLERDASLPACLAALLQQTPRLRRLRLAGLGPDEYGGIDGLDEEDDLPAAGLPPSLAALSKLQELVVTGFWLTSLPEGPYLASCTRMDVHDNCFTRLPPVLSRASRLQQLCLAPNDGLMLDVVDMILLARLPALMRVELPSHTPYRLLESLAQLAPHLHVTQGWQFR
ncbi:E3 ubiquitin- ligase UPL7 [Chlorella sorokiniana]|uniref:HECT-type E3 ubiquitin transferase n=1 Tax=Chlorella sorokiniana TaxID=3076 RepID=A0A2P6TJV6_CHLSO|nr:E3 ubiquitin- ligase UPL7 [Chlorella sorokiniana]|eukprot:PRW44359.1 E3 ubiquitin- ligase UPL7 [Chlorella sorokiniana]